MEVEVELIDGGFFPELRLFEAQKDAFFLPVFFFEIGKGIDNLQG